MVIRTTIRTALRTVEYWKEHNIPSLAAQRALPRRIEPVPETASQAIEYARALSVTAANHLSRGFDALREAAVEMETMREAKSIPPDFYAVAATKISGFLESAQQALEKAEAELPPA